MFRRVASPVFLASVARRLLLNNEASSSLWRTGGFSVQKTNLLSTTPTRGDLMEFFDDKKNWGEATVRVGRSWQTDELRLKSNTDLHKLWYILLKEKNMLLTMQQASKDEGEFFPNPERVDKVEESMKNLEEVVRERNRAYYLLETGSTGERPGAEEENFLGLPEYSQFKEYPVPKQENKEYLKAKSEEPVVLPSEKSWFLIRLNEKQLRQKRWERFDARRHVRQIIHRFPDVDREVLKEKYPDINIERVIDQTNDRYLGNVKPKTFRWNRNR